MIIDAHAHIIPGDFPDVDGFPRMLATDRDDVRRLMFGRTDFAASEVFFAAERRLEALDRSRVDHEVVSPMPPLLNYALPPHLGRDLFRFVNDSVAEIVAAGAGRIHGLGVVPMQDPALACAELERIVELRLSGVEVGSHIDGVAIGDERFVEFFREAENRKLGVFVHSLPRLDEVALPTHLRASIGVGIEGARGAASLALGPAADACTNDRILFSHAAGGLPLMLARADYFWEQSDPASRATCPPSEVARRFLYDSMVFDRHGLRFVVDYLGADRIVLGSDYPAMLRPATLSTLLDDIDATVSEREAIGSANALRFLGVSPSSAGTMR